MHHGGNKLPFEKDFPRIREISKFVRTTNVMFPGPSAEENVIYRYECTSYKTRLSCVIKTILPVIDLYVYLLNL